VFTYVYAFINTVPNKFDYDSFNKKKSINIYLSLVHTDKQQINNRLTSKETTQKQECVRVERHVYLQTVVSVS